MWSLTKIVFVTVGLYLVVTNMMDMIRDPVPSNIGVQAVSVAIGGGLLAYGFHVTPVTGLVNSIVGGVKDVVIDALKMTSKVARETTAAAGK